VNAYVINLDSRKDRLRNSLNQASLLGFPLVRIQAITAENLVDSDLQFAAPGVAATWLSHKKAASEFLKTDSEYALILEDDFQLNHPLALPKVEWLANNSVDFLQVGFLYVTKWESIDIAFINCRDVILRVIRFCSAYSKFLDSKFSSRLLIKELPKSSFKLIPTDIRPGGHCYIISRSFAEAMQTLNNPIVFSADELFVSISRMRAFKMLRFRKSMVSQDNSPSSVQIRFKLS
jgi:GR25 family glycosyltransferase involved in LPS biosynthesis